MPAINNTAAAPHDLHRKKEATEPSWVNESYHVRSDKNAEQNFHYDNRHTHPDRYFGEEWR
jgi:hypothetical protein